MRSTRKVLVYCSNEARGRSLAYVLLLRGFAPYWCGDAATLERSLRVNQFHAALVVEAGERDHAEPAVRAIRAADPSLKVLLAMAGMHAIQTLATRVLGHDADVCGLVDAVRQACVQRRVSKPVALRVEAAVTPESVAPGGSAHLGAVSA